MDKRGVIIISGGADSATLLHYINVKYPDMGIYALSFNYGQKHVRELQFAQYHCDQLGINLKIVDITTIHELLAVGALTGNDEMPMGEHYTAANQKKTIVPNRNAILLNIAVGYAVTIGAGKVFAGVHSSDYIVYVDCRKEFIKALDTAVYLGNLDTPVEIEVPFIDYSKADIIKEGLSLGVDYRHTNTCYSPVDERQCGRCASCGERVMAFVASGAKDPLYSDREWEEVSGFWIKKDKEYRKEGR